MYHRACFVVAVLLVSSVSVKGSMMITHSGDTDPTTEGWWAYATVGGVNWDYTVIPDAGPVTTDGIAAWRILDTATQGSNELPYRYDASLAGSNWRYSAYVKAYERNSAANSRLNASLDVNVQTSYYFGTPIGYRHRLTLYDNGQGGTEVYVFGNTPFVTTIDGNGFHWVEMIHQSGVGTALFINGELVTPSLPTSSYSVSYGTVRWGDTIFVNGGEGGADWGYVEFEHDPQETFEPIGVPEPASIALLAAGACVALARRRR